MFALFTNLVEKTEKKLVNWQVEKYSNSCWKSVSFSLQPFHRFVEIGRIAVLQDGPRAGKIAAIVDVIDQNRVRLEFFHFNDVVNHHSTLNFTGFDWWTSSRCWTSRIQNQEPSFDAFEGHLRFLRSYQSGQKSLGRREDQWKVGWIILGQEDANES